MKPLDPKEKAWLWESLMWFGRQQGPSPDDHPSVRNRIEREYQSIVLIITVLSSKLSGTPGNYTLRFPSWRHKAASCLRHPLFAAGVILAAVIPTYLEIAEARKLVFTKRTREEAVGRAILTNPGIVTTFGDQQVSISVSEGLTTSGEPTSFKINHALTSEQLENVK